MKQAQQQLRAAIEIDLTDPRPYSHLMNDVMGPSHDSNGLDAVARQAIDSGADPVTIEQAKANAATSAGDTAAAEAALVQVSRDAPTYSSMKNLGVFYNDNPEIQPRDSCLPACA